VIALTGIKALEYFRNQEELLSQAASLLRSPPAELPKRIESLQKENRELQRAAEKARTSQTGDVVIELLAKAVTVGPARIVVSEVAGASTDQMRAHCDALRAKASPLASLLASTDNGKVNLVASVSKELVERGMHAGKWLQKVAEVMDGKGGGQPLMAQGGGKNPAKLPEAIERAFEVAKEMLAT
jgi:alanyl-tRNA synthetase